MYDNAAKVQPMNRNRNCRLHTSASYWGGVTINVVDFKIHEVDFVSQANSCPSSQFSCACCGIIIYIGRGLDARFGARRASAFKCVQQRRCCEWCRIAVWLLGVGFDGI